MNSKQDQKQYTKGFNEGYLLSLHEPNTLKQIMKNNKNDSPYLKGITAGQHTQQQELFVKNLKTARQTNQKLSHPKMRR